MIDKIEAHVGSKIITSYDIEMLNPAVYKQIIAIKDETIKEEQLKAYKEQALNFLIDMYVMEIAAEKDGIRISDKDVDRAVSEIAASNKLSMADFERTLAAQNLSLKQYRYQIKSQLILRSKINVPQIVITEEDIMNMVDKKQEEFGLKDMYEISMITMQNKSDINKGFEEQDLLDETKAILANIFRDYWATPYQRERIIAKEKYDRQKIEDEKRIKYNSNDIFTKRNAVKIESKPEQTINNLPVNTQKNSFFKKIINFFKKLFHLGKE